jgi:hypothetical protein
MGMVVMSKRELNRLDVLARLDSDRLTARAAAELMTITLRQTYRLLRRYRDGGASAIANQRRGRPSNNRLPDVVRDHAIALVRERYADLGRHSRPRSWQSVMISKFRGRRCAAGCGRRGSGCPALNASASSNLGIAASMLVSWSKSTAQSIAGSRIVQRSARYWCSSTMRQAV